MSIRLPADGDDRKRAERRPGALSAQPARWLEGDNPVTHRRIKVLRLVTAYAIAAMLSAVLVLHQTGNASALSSLAGGFALWASVSEGQASRGKSNRDLLVLCVAAVAGALSIEPPRISWRPFGLGQAAKAWTSAWA